MYKGGICAARPGFRVLNSPSQVPRLDGWVVTADTRQRRKRRAVDIRHINRLVVNAGWLKHHDRAIGGGLREELCEPSDRIEGRAVALVMHPILPASGAARPDRAPEEHRYARSHRSEVPEVYVHIGHPADGGKVDDLASALGHARGAR